MNARSKALLWAMVPVLLLLPLLLWLGKNFEHQLLDEQRTRTQHTLDLYSGAAQRSLDQMVGKLERLEVFVAGQTAGGRPVDAAQFNTFAAGLHASSEWIRAFQIVSDGVITQTYPLKGNEAALGYNLMTDPRHLLGGDVVRAWNTGRETITGPLPLIQGGLGIILRKPLPRTNDGHARLVAIVLNLAPLLAEAGVSEKMTNGVQLAIRQATGEVFFGPPSVFAQQPVTRRLSLPDGSWEMGASPLNGWRTAASTPIRLFHLAGAVIIFLLGLLVFATARRQADLQETVQERTHALQIELAARQRAQEQLRENYSLLQAVTEGTSDAVFVKDLRGGYKMINSAGARFLGRAPADIIEKNDLELYSAETARDIMAGDRKVIESGLVQTLEERGTAAGVTRIYQATKAPWRDDEGTVIGVVGVSRDITGRKEADAAIRRERDFSAALLDSLPGVFYLYDENGRFLRWNKNFERVTGYTADEMTQRHPLDFYAGPDKALLAARIAEVFAKGESEAEADFVAKDGTRTPYFFSGLRTEIDGRPHLLGVGIDISARKRAEAAMRESELKFRTIIDFSPVAMSVSDENGNVVLVNRKFVETFGYTLADIPTVEAWWPLAYPDSAYRERVAQAWQAAAEQARRNHTELEPMECKVTAKNGAVRDIRFSMAPMGTSSLVIHYDLTDRKQAEEQVRRLHEALQRHAAELELRVAERTAELEVARNQAEVADRMKSAFLATMSHELRTPLNSIIGFTGIILQGLTGPLNAEQNKQLEMVRSSARHLLALINDVLDISKIEAGELRVALAPFDLRATIERSVAAIRPFSESKRLALRVAIAPRIGPLVSDARRVEQILLNLLNNAVKFTEQGEVFLSAGVVEAKVRVQITDTGIGIRPEDLADLFRPFQQVDSGLSRSHEGTGLGLVICRRLAGLLGGEIGVESAPGKGSTFTVSLPLRPLSKS